MLGLLDSYHDDVVHTRFAEHSLAQTDDTVLQGQAAACAPASP